MVRCERTKLKSFGIVASQLVDVGKGDGGGLGPWVLANGTMLFHSFLSSFFSSFFFSPFGGVISFSASISFSKPSMKFVSITSSPSVKCARSITCWGYVDMVCWFLFVFADKKLKEKFMR